MYSTYVYTLYIAVQTHLCGGALQEVLREPPFVPQEHCVHVPPSDLGTEHQEGLDGFIPLQRRTSEVAKEDKDKGGNKSLQNPKGVRACGLGQLATKSV